MWPVIPVAIPLFAAALLAALTKIIRQRVSQYISIAVVLLTLADTIYLVHLSSAQPVVYWFGGWTPRHGLALGISFVVDPIGAGFAGFVAFLTLAALVFSSEYFDTVGNHFHALLLAFLAAMCGFSLTGDMFNMFVFFELMSAAGFALCGYKTDDPSSLQGAFNFAITNTIAAYFILIGIAILYARTDALNMAQMGRALASSPLDTLVMVAFVFVVCGYLVKAAIVPFHFWLADAHAVAPTPVCVLFSGVMVEMGLFALARIYWAVFGSTLHSHSAGLIRLFVGIGVATTVVGAFMCYIQSHLKRLLAFSTVSHVGIMLIGIGLFAPAGLAGAAVYALGHGLAKGALFLVTGILLHRFEEVDERDLHGKARGLWFTAALFLLGALALAGIPTSGLGVGHDLMNDSAKAAGLVWVRWIFIFGGALTSAAVLRAGGRVFFGWGKEENPGAPPRHEEKPDTREGHEHTPATMFVPAAVLMLAALSLAFIPNLESSALAAAARFQDSAAYAAHVLESRPFSSLPAATPHALQWSDALIAVIAAILIAMLDLFSSTSRRVGLLLTRPLRLLHRIHSGHIGDYIAFLTFGIAFFGLLCAYCFRG
jgi:multicomponent Na+:H+ antiporter subunit D